MIYPRFSSLPEAGTSNRIKRQPESS